MNIQANETVSICNLGRRDLRLLTFLQGDYFSDK